LSAVRDTIAASGASHLVTIINQQSMIETPAPILRERHLRIAVNDIAQPIEGLIHPAAHHIEELIGFVTRWDRTAPMLFHCLAGISRSTAGCFITLCALNPDAPELELARRLRRASPTASPNRLMVELADDALGRRGRMVDALDEIGPGAIAAEGRAFSLPATFS
jgi:predicted protein tyrosine phosphatase